MDSTLIFILALEAILFLLCKGRIDFFRLEFDRLMPASVERAASGLVMKMCFAQAVIMPMQLVLAMQWGEAYPSGVFIFLATVLCAYLVAAVVLFQFFKVQTQALQMAHDAGQNN